MHEYYGDENVLNTLTLKTEGTKSTVLVCAKGIGINNDDAQVLADLIPFERGANWSLKDCFEGNEEKGRLPQKEFINAVNNYKGLKELLLKIEGLITGRSIHASASYIFDAGYLVQNSKMRAPNGTWITSFNMEDSDYMGGLKIDTLTIQTLDMLHKAIDLLIEDNIIEDKGSIKANYDAYLHPDVLEYNDYKMWNMFDDLKILNVFQFDTEMGKQVTLTTQPRSFFEMTTANTLMRLMAQEDSTESPMETYRKHKDNINIWYKEMRDFGLNEDEIETMKKHLGVLYGVADSQESVMQLSMDPKISGFDIVLSNKLRKTIAKKKANMIEEVKEKFYSMGEKLGTRKVLLDYVWQIQFKRQFGYSFSLNHVAPYTCIGIQCMNIVLRYGALYWNCACLAVDSGSVNDDSEEGTNYGKISSSMGKMKKEGINVSLPDINRSHYGFHPDVSSNEIVYGLKPIQGIGTKVAKAIIANQPYSSVDDFYNKMQVYKSQETEDGSKNTFGDKAMITLIKAGCFDELEKNPDGSLKPRQQIMEEFIRKISEPIKSLKISNIEDLNSLGLLTEHQKKHELRFYRFRNYLFQKKFFVKQTGKSPTTVYYKLDRKFAEPFFMEHFEINMVEDKDYEYNSDGFIIVKKGSIDRDFKKLMEDFKNTTLNKPENLQAVNEAKFKEVWNEKAVGNLSKWEMDSMCFYYHEHELAHVDKEYHSISNFDDLPNQPVIANSYFYKGKEQYRFELNRICGTVLDRDKNKHIVTLLTLDGVVNVKFYKGQFGFYDRQISQINKDGSKTVLEKSWFSRGTKLLITGFRREEQFVAKTYKNSIYKHSVQLIKSIDDKGILTLQSDRIDTENEEDFIKTNLD